MFKSLFSIFRPKLNLCTECHATKAVNVLLNRQNTELKEEIAKLRSQLRNRTSNFLPSTNILERCEICSTIIRQNELSQHFCLNQVKTVKCQYCMMQFGSTQDLISHLKETVHTDVKFYKCDKCTMGFPSAVLFKFHKMIHGKSMLKSESHEPIAKRSVSETNQLTFHHGLPLFQRSVQKLEPSTPKNQPKTQTTIDITTAKCNNFALFELYLATEHLDSWF